MYWMFLPFRRYFDFSGRSRRLEYWLFLLFNLFVAVLVTMLGIEIEENSAPGKSGGMDFGSKLLLAYALGISCPVLALQVRRLHDLEKSGWYVLLGLIPYIGGPALAYLLAQKGTPGENAYGPDPLRPETDISDFL
ncbi:hypothetical protein SZ64_17990 [Erythrobacter sp. SG61-1L]|nr:hypothetical protein SZ64_17455 [Erythrobacter sp. SG61-1L]KPL69823.1 hypothetical protein SZ64_17990 [Erythrobacter sp. SG61-1L]